MTSEPINQGGGDLEARIIPLCRPAPIGDSPLEREAKVGADTSFEVTLDPDEDEPNPRHQPVYVDAVAVDHETLPIIPAYLRGRANIKAAAKVTAKRHGRVVGFHAVRVPFMYLPLATFWSVVGVFKLTGRQLSWWWVAEQTALRQEAANSNDPLTWLKLDKQASQKRLWRGMVLAAEGLGLLVTLTLLLTVAPGWLQLLVTLVAVPTLAHFGRPDGRPIVRSAVVTQRFRKLSGEIVLRAYYSAKLGHPDRPDQQVMFGSTMSRDAMNTGSQVVVDLPYGTTFADAIKAKAAIASGLDVTEQQVFLTGDRTSTRRHTLFVADRDPLAIPAGATPLLDLKRRCIWDDMPFGLDERGRDVKLSLLWQSWLIGAQPRKGKTFSARLLALFAALDPYTKLFIVDGKNSPDWRSFSLVADMVIYGTHPGRDGDPIEQLLITLRMIKKHIQKVNDILSTLPPTECPEGKLTRDLSRDKRFPDLRVWVLVMEEFQVYFETEDQDVNKEIAGLLSFIIAVGPSAGVIVESSSQKPSGVGAGDVSRLFNRYRDNHTARFALKCGNRNVSEAILGTEAYGEGYDAASLPNGPEYRGVGILYGLSDDVPTVRTYLATGSDAEVICQAARKHREAAGTLSGMAAGEDVARQFRDVLADVRDVFYAGEAWISWAQLSSRLAEQMPEHYADITKEAISAQVRALGAKEKKGRDGGQSLWGVPRAHVEFAMESRILGGVQ